MATKDSVASWMGSWNNNNKKTLGKTQRNMNKVYILVNNNVQVVSKVQVLART